MAEMSRRDTRVWAQEKLADACRNFMRERIMTDFASDPLDADEERALNIQLQRVLIFLGQKKPTDVF